MSSSSTESEEMKKTEEAPPALPSVVDLLGPSLMVNPQTKKSTLELLKNKKVILLYFSAHWCPPCQAFTPKLRDFYKAIKKAQGDACNIEIIYVSSDRSLSEFNDYYGKMPWLAIPTDKDSAQVKNQLAEKLQITGIPALIGLKVQEGAGGGVLFLTDQGRNQVMNALSSSSSSSSPSSSSPQSLVEEWRNQPAVPLEQAQLGGGSGSTTFGGALWQMILAILKNPIYMFGMLYFFKMFVRNMYSGSSSSDDLQGETGEQAAASQQLEDSEF